MPKRRRNLRKPVPFGSRITDHFRSKRTKLEGHDEDVVKSEPVQIEDEEIRLSPGQSHDENEVRSGSAADIAALEVKPALDQVCDKEDDKSKSGQGHDECENISDEDLIEEHEVKLEYGEGHEENETQFESGEAHEEGEVKFESGEGHEEGEVKFEPGESYEESEARSDSDISYERYEVKSESDEGREENEINSDLDLFDEAEDVNGGAISGTRSSPSTSVIDLGAEGDDGDEGDYASASSDLAFLRKFDMDWRFGPCIGISRLERFDRAVQNGLRPPQRVRSLVLLHSEEERYTECVWHVYNYL